MAAVDGLRALAALWVVAFHLRAFSGAHLSAVPGLDLLLRSGSTGVSLFLVLSGFCLYSPFAGGRLARFRTRRFLARRCRRLLPAYYASLVAFLVLSAASAGRFGLPSMGAQTVAAQAAAHATMVHTLFPPTFYAVNGAYWSLGLEWQLYLGLPVLVIAARRWGFARMVVAVVALNLLYRLVIAAAAHGAVTGSSSVSDTVLPNLLPGRWAEFAFGMVAAELQATGRVAPIAHRLRYAVLPLICLSLAVSNLPISHILFGAVFFALLCVTLEGSNVVARALAWRPLAGLGLMSYSLYLVHQPLIQAAGALLRSHGASPGTTFLALVAMLPLIVLAAWLLFVTVERHTLTSGTAPAAIPAPPSRTALTGRAAMAESSGQP